MKKNHFATLLIAFSSITNAACATESATVTSRTVALSFIAEQVNSNWVGHNLSYHIGRTPPVAIVVIRNFTSAPPQMHAERIRMIIEFDPVLQAKPTELKGGVWFDCLAIMEDGNIIRIERSGDWGRLSTENGQAYFHISDVDLIKKMSNHAVEPTHAP